MRVTSGLGGGTRSSSTARVAADGAYVVFESESDELGLGLADNVYHIYRKDLATEVKLVCLTVNADVGQNGYKEVVLPEPCAIITAGSTAVGKQAFAQSSLTTLTVEYDAANLTIDMMAFKELDLTVRMACKAGCGECTGVNACTCATRPLVLDPKWDKNSGSVTFEAVCAAGGLALVTPADQDSSDNSKYASSSADSKNICYFSNAPNNHTNHCESCDTEYQWWLAEANAANTGFKPPTMLSWSSQDGRKATANGRCQVSNDGSAVATRTCPRPL